MPAGDGITITRRGDRWLYRVGDGAGGRRNKTFARDPEADANRRIRGCAAGDAWAERMRAALVLKQETGGRVLLAQVGEAYAVTREAAGRSAAQVGIIRNVVERAVAGGLNDLHDDALPDRCQRFLARLTACRPGQRTPTPASPRLRNKVLTVLRAIGSYTVKRRLLAHNPFAAVERAKEKRRLRPTFRIDELRELVADVHRADPAFILAALAVYTGQRSETLRLMTWGMVDWERRRIVIPSAILKQDLPVRAPLQVELADLLRPIAGVGSATIVPPSTARDSDHANEVFQGYLRRCGIAYEKRGLHALRHSFASLLTATGVPMGLVMDAVGHAQTQTARGYQSGATDYVDQVRREAWLEGELYLRRDPPDGRRVETMACQNTLPCTVQA